MPELPEVEIVRRRLHPQVVGRAIVGVEVWDPTVSPLDGSTLRERLTGRRVVGTGRRGKWLLLETAGPSPVEDHTVGDVVLIVHLRMTGRLLFRPPEDGRASGPRLILRFDDGSQLLLYDVRRFGRVWALPASELKVFFADLGVEPLGDDFTVAVLRELMAGRRAPIKSFLLDQRKIAGVGNIYADEALFRARLHPLRPAGSVGPREAARLHAAVRETLELGIAHEGSSVESFVDPAGARGSFQEILNVYQRTGLPCRVCGTPIRRIVVGGRGTHFCPRCQPRRAMRLRTARASAPAAGTPARRATGS